MRLCLQYFLLPSLAVLTIGCDAVKPEGDRSVDAVLLRGRLPADTDLCEVDQDNAARLYASARASRTDWDLARRDVGAVALLREVRQALDAWESTIFATGSVLTHGGTLWSHTGARAPADIEDFLAGLAPKFPSDPDMERYVAINQLPATPAVLARINGLAPIGPDGFSTPEQLAERNRDLADQKRRLREAWFDLERTLLVLPADLADPIADRATRHLQLLDEAR